MSVEMTLQKTSLNGSKSKEKEHFREHTTRLNASCTPSIEWLTVATSPRPKERMVGQVGIGSIIESIIHLFSSVVGNTSSVEIH